MIQIIEKERFTLHEIDADCKDSFIRRVGCTSLSDFESFFLKVLGDALRPKKSEHFWCGNDYRWYVRSYDKNGDATHDAEFAVWLTDNGIAMYEDFDAGKLYRVMF